MSLLPVRRRPAAGQCVTDWLEHVAEDNGMLTTQLDSMLRQAGATTRFLPVKPNPRTVTTLSELTGAAASQIALATLARYDGTAVNLDDLTSNRWSSWRNVAGRGWFRLRGTAACPKCLAEDGYWQIGWRLSTVTVCPRHGCYLIYSCPGCGRKFADHPRSAFRGGTGTRCLNPLGVRTVCPVDVANLATVAADAADIARQIRHDRACEGSPTTVLGGPGPAQDYLANTRHLAVLLLHLATRPSANNLAPWVDDARREAQATDRVRWHLAPPADPRLRSAVLTSADEILTALDTSAGADLLATWVEAAPSGTESRLGWLADRTTMTPTLTHLTMAALAPHQRISTHLNRTDAPFRPSRIPQAVPEPLYRRHAGGLFMTAEGETNRLFLSLCLARQAGADNWADAADSIGLQPDLGTRTARSVSARSRPDPRELTAALERIRTDLHGNFRAREHQVRQLPADDWFEAWAGDFRPGTRLTSVRYAVAFLWCRWASGILATSPGWTAAPTRTERSAYRQFASSLDRHAAQALLAIPRQWSLAGPA
ncbi:hypothetical protein IU11_01395 [Cellulosimicrobium sp. MM]|nr:TniQ family protein [Cellulosimicrobium sp. MM]KFD44547.1 hypothetical protein IU11_01395 [Cellulosimicrobium sp. MM]